jgi:hypothetical protein
MDMATHTIPPDAAVVRAPGLMSSDLDGETVLMSVERLKYYGLEATADRIWRLIEHPRRASEICATLLAEYAVDRARCEQQVQAFLDELRREGLVQVEVPELA